MADFDLLIRSGTVIDGSGKPRARADVAVRNDRVAATGALADARAAATIDATGLIVAPGFIDVHNHSDGWLLKIPHFASKTLQGFTTEVLMSDGISYAPTTTALAPQWLYYLRSLNGLALHDYEGWQSIGDYMQLLDRRTVQNVIAQVCYANVRVMEVGWGRGRPDDSQLRRMRYEVRRGMDEGATGVSTGLDYVSQFFAETDELVEVIAASAAAAGVYVTHVRYKRGTLAGVREAVEIGRRAGVAVHISHLKGANQREAEELLAYIDNTAVHEVDFSFDIYPYLPGSSMLNQLLPYEVWENGPLGVLARLADPTVRRHFAAQLADGAVSLENIRIAWVGSVDNQHLRGLSLAEYARRVARPPADALCDLLIEENLAVTCVFHLADDSLVEPFLAHPRFMLGSDGIYFPDALVHPRQYGSAPRILGALVRERRLFTLEEAVRKMTSIPATRFGLTDRGVIEEGAFADLVVFNPDTITDRATYADPQQHAVGVEHVIVNGTPIVAAGAPIDRFDGPLPGRALRYRA
ncbi:MAG TPA: D-aminoacylase [Pirellulales bacterium]|nr:D-aminoacylase [Pirellulales bacterium]